MKCQYFDNPQQISAGEHLLLNSEGGAIALLSTTRLVYSAPNYNLNTKFIQTVFEKQDRPGSGTQAPMRYLSKTARK